MSQCCCHSEKEKNDHEHSHVSQNENSWQYFPVVLTFCMLILGMLFDYLDFPFFKKWEFLWYVVGYFLVGFPILKESYKSMLKGEIFTEFLLMSLAGVGAFCIGEYSEGVAVLLFYSIGELFQEKAVRKAKKSIQSLLQLQVKNARVFRDGHYQDSLPENIAINEKIQVLKGEKIPLDGVLLSENAVVNTSALTGESRPQFLTKNKTVFAGTINLENVIEIRVTKKFSDSSLARILDLVENASKRKSKTELFIRRFARIYTPIVVLLAALVLFVPFLFLADYNFSQWLYRSLVFLVISCPCALVISIPLGYFGGVGAASLNGILFKGSCFLDLITGVKTVVMDKTGTLTEGIFKIKEIHCENITEKELMGYLIAMEKQSTHPIAKAILEYKGADSLLAENVKEFTGMGLSGLVDGKQIIVGNTKLFSQKNIKVPAFVNAIVETCVVVGVEGQFVGYITISDSIKKDAPQAIEELKNLGVENIVLLSGDKDTITQKVAQELEISKAKGALLPEDKFAELEKLKKKTTEKIAFVGDGINDAPSLALSDVGIAMGALGSDVAIETADVVIQTDEPSKIATAIKIGKATRKVIWQNIGLTFGVKILVMLLGALGLATMWEAVFADVGVALLAILNATRLQRMQF